jgi:hypothetical protein
MMTPLLDAGRGMRDHLSVMVHTGRKEVVIGGRAIWRGDRH